MQDFVSILKKKNSAFFYCGLYYYTIIMWNNNLEFPLKRTANENSKCYCSFFKRLYFMNYC